MIFKLYTRLIIVAIFLLLFFGVTSSLIYSLEPLDGDLTRLGWLSEYDYGWNGLEYSFDPPLTGKGKHGTPYDVIVIGDSFSNSENWGWNWHNYLKRDTGLSVGVFSILEFNIDEFINSPEYKRHPPKFLIYETVERHLISLYSRISTEGCEYSLPKLTLPPVTTNPIVSELKSIKRNSEFVFNIGYGLKFLWTKFSPFKKVEVVIHPLKTKTLFSSRKSDELLTYSVDIEKSKWSIKMWDKVKCQMRNLQRSAQSNNYTTFLIMVVPDKLTIYADYLEDPKWKDISRYHTLFDDDDLNVLPLLPYFQKSVGLGEKDIYLPNNTHWSSSGSALASQATVDYMRRKNLVE